MQQYYNKTLSQTLYAYCAFFHNLAEIDIRCRHPKSHAGAAPAYDLSSRKTRSRPMDANAIKISFLSVANAAATNLPSRARLRRKSA